MTGPAKIIDSLAGRHPAVIAALRWFEHAHLPEHLAAVSARFAVLAEQLATDLNDSPELMNALQALIVAKDAAVRAAILTHETNAAATPGNPAAAEV